MIKTFVSIILLFAFMKAFADSKTDLQTMNTARKQYAEKQLDKAIETYSSISKASEYWPLAIEERAHTYGKKGEYNKAIADLTTLFSPLLEKSIGPEPYFTAALTYLKLCQYSKVYDLIQKFKSNMRPRIISLTEIVDGKGNDKIFDAAIKLRTGEYNALAYAKDSADLPLLFHLDSKVNYEIRKNFNNDNDSLVNRVKMLAQMDLDEITKNLKKLQLVEIEVMQRLRSQEKQKDSKRVEIGKINQKDMQLKFPYNENEREIWIDEIDNYQVKAKGCPVENKQGKSI